MIWPIIVHLVTEQLSQRRRRVESVDDFSQIARLVKHVLISRAPPWTRPKKSISRTHPRESGEDGSREARYLGGSVVARSEGGVDYGVLLPI